MSVRIPLRESKLKGYHLHLRADARRRVLTRGINKKTVSYAEIVRRLNALAIMNKRRYPGVAKKIRADMKFLRRKYRGGDKKNKPARKRTTKPRRETKTRR